MLIAGNAGHYPGLDPGACGQQITEAELAKRYVERINGYLEAAGVSTIFIQENDLQPICDAANYAGADFFYSLHFNAASNPAALGTETYYASGSSKGEVLARCIQNQLVSTLGTVDRGLKTNRLYVTAHTDMPAVLIEVGFISNPEEEQMLIDREDDACRAIARGVTDALIELGGGSESSAPSQSYSNDYSPEGLKPGMAGKYFSKAELACHCCGRENAQPELVKFLDDVREAIGRPLNVSCAYRCPKHNAEVGGVPNSAHVMGLACDMWVEGMSVDELAQVCIDQGADGIGRYYGQEFVHADVRDGRTGLKYEWVG